MSSSEDSEVAVTEGFADSLADAARQFSDMPDDPGRLTGLAESLFRHFCAQVAEGQGVRLIRGTQNVSATETLMVAAHLLRQANIEVFELALWQQWNREGQ